MKFRGPVRGRLGPAAPGVAIYWPRQQLSRHTGGGKTFPSGVSIAMSKALDGLKRFRCPRSSSFSRT
jgi:hypothetical protein